MAYSMISHILILLVVSTASAHYITNSTDAFHDVLHFVNGPFSVETKLNAESLEEIYHELFEKGDCEDNSANCSIVSNTYTPIIEPHVLTTHSVLRQQESSVFEVDLYYLPLYNIRLARQFQRVSILAGFCALQFVFIIWTKQNIISGVICSIIDKDYYVNKSVHSLLLIST